ncbi:MAG TPA: hypothetical protein VKU62_09455 [Thermoanaerobaculia bacterium]|nr:hypothetical protein [Thermoanaerobaculia bacterium]
MSHDASGPKQLPRRDFLKIASITTLGLAVPSRLLRAMPISTPDGAGEPLLAIGYAEAVPKAGENVRVRSASSVLTGDPSFLQRGARVKFSSFARAEQYRNQRANGVAVDVVYDALSYTPSQLPRFRAWSYAGRESGDHVSGPIAFSVPVTATDGLQLVLRRMTAGVAETAANAPRGVATENEISAKFTMSSDAGALKLCRGAYVIAFREGSADNLSSWNAFRLADDNGNLVLMPAPFTYVVMTIDYAS